MSFISWFWARAPLLLTCATMMWAANVMASRVAVGQISPMMLTSSRWLLITLMMFTGMRAGLRQYGAQMWAHKWLILLLSATGLTGFNALSYTAAHFTTAVNMVLLQCLIPALVLIGAAWRGDVILKMQYVGVATTTLGVAMVATSGHLADIVLLKLNAGDALVLFSCFIGAFYNLAISRRPKIPATIFFGGLALGSFIASVPLVGVEAAIGEFQWPTPLGWVIVLFAALGPALAAQVFFLRAVDLIGPDRAGVYNNLVPVFGALFGVFLLGEVFAWYHAVGLALVLAGIFLCEHGKRRGMAKE